MIVLKFSLGKRERLLFILMSSSSSEVSQPLPWVPGLGVVTLAAVIRVPIWCFVPIISLSCPQLYLFNLRVWPMWIRDWFCYPSTNLDPSLFIEYSDRRYAHIQPEISSQPTHVYSPTTNKYSRYVLNWTLTAWIWWLFDNFRNQNLNINVNVRKM